MEDEKEPLLTREQAAAELGVSLSTIMRMEKDGRLKVIKLADRIRIDPDSVKEQIEIKNRKRKGNR